MQPVQERQRRLRLEEPTHLGPVASRQLGQRRGDLLPRPGPIVQPAVGTEHRATPPGPSPARFGRSYRAKAASAFFQADARRSPRPAYPGSAAAPAPPGGWRPRPPPRALHLVPALAQGPLGLLGRVEHVQAVLQRGLPLLASLLLHQRRSRPAGPSRRRRETYCSAVQSLQGLAPGRARAIVGLVPEEPGHAGRLDAHQHGTAMEEDLIEAADQDQRPALRSRCLRTRAAAVRRP